MIDLRHRLQADRGRQRLEKLVERVPGYAGYARKEARRDADRALRLHVADLLKAQRRRIEDIQAGLLDANLLRELPPIEAAVLRLQTLADEIRTASYGYAGWFDAKSIDEAELAALYEHDLSLAEGVDWIAANVERLSSAVAQADEEEFRRAAGDLNATLDRIAEQVIRRRQIVSEAKRPPALSPRQILAAAESALKGATTFPELGPGDAIGYGGVDYAVVGKVAYRHQGKSWQAYLLQNGEERWLWSTDGGRQVFLATPVPPPEDMNGKDRIDWEDEELALVETGSAVADVEGPSGRQGNLQVRYRRFAAQSGRALWVEEWGDKTEAYLGDPISQQDVEIWRRSSAG